MLPPDEVLQFLIHGDQDARVFARKYFSDLADTAPAETAGLISQSIDRFGDCDLIWGTNERTSALRDLWRLPQDGASVERAMQLLRQGGLDSDSESNLFELLAALPLHFLKPNRAEISAGVDAVRRATIEHRFGLATKTADELWNELVELGVKSENAQDSSEVETENVAQLLEALTAFPQTAVVRVTETVGEQIDRYWLETWCIDLLGRLRHTSMIDQLIKRMVDDDGDFMHVAACWALGRMDPAQTVPALQANYGQNNNNVRLRFGRCLGYIKDPLAETALMQFLETETDPEVVSSLCKALVDICTTEAIEPLRQVVISDRYDRMFADPKEDFVLLSKMLGFETPELRSWEAEIKNPQYRRQRRRDFLGKLGMTEATADLLKRLLIEKASAKQLIKNPPKLGYEGVDATLPIRRKEPKIGRNDPCPCGSGKKYKKCCDA